VIELETHTHAYLHTHTKHRKREIENKQTDNLSNINMSKRLKEETGFIVVRVVEREGIFVRMCK